MHVCVTHAYEHTLLCYLSEKMCVKLFRFPHFAHHYESHQVKRFQMYDLIYDLDFDLSFAFTPTNKNAW
jgi:hypothetical protein